MRVPQRTNEGKVPQQRHTVVRVSPLEEDGRLSSIKPTPTNRIVLKTSLSLCKDRNLSITSLTFLPTS